MLSVLNGHLSINAAHHQESVPAVGSESQLHTFMRRVRNDFPGRVDLRDCSLRDFVR